MALHQLSSDDLRQVHREFERLRYGNGLTRKQMADLVAKWEPIVRPDEKDRAEDFAVAMPDGTTTGAIGPRWVFHMFGLRHRAAHVGLSTPSGLIVLQRRGATKEDWPNALDMAVAGHIPQGADGKDISFEQGAWKETGEEIGIEESFAATAFAEGRLTPMGAPYFSFDRDIGRNPRFYNAEVRQVFAATLTGDGLARLRFTDSEATGLLLASPETAWDILEREPVASGLRYSLPRYLDWLSRRP